MSKSFLLIDTPCDCDSCPYVDDVGYTCGAFQILGEKYTFEVPEVGKLKQCPLKSTDSVIEALERGVKAGYFSASSTLAAKDDAIKIVKRELC